ncbi:MAG: agmatine deiminase family protein [Bacteroides sp.]|jgi:agmatine/peptidylarginine deiminase|nr:agmatine deiminase family protein [Bacteroides sp.]
MFLFRPLTILFFISLFLNASVFAQEPLPHWMTEAEKAIFQDYLDNIPEGKSTSPPIGIPRAPGEFEEVQGVIVTWASYSYELREIVRHAREVVTVYIICSNISNVQNYLTSGNVSLDNIVFIQASFNSVWVRDYGPQSIYLAEDGQLAFADWVYNRPRPLDDQIPVVMSDHLDLPIYQMTSSPNRLVATGGNFMTDGFGTGFSSELILAENSSLSVTQIDNIAHNYLGIDRYIKMPELPYDNISHIDMHMKLINEETLLVGEFPTGVSDGPYIENNLQAVLQNFPSVYDRQYKVVRIPMPASSSGSYSPYTSYRTYTNSLILNDLVLVPIYGLFPDSQALQIYEDAMPGCNIVGINMESVIGASGAIHCIAREIAADDPILFAHASPDTLPSWQDSYEMKAAIHSYSDITEAQFYWTKDPQLGFTTEEMLLENDTFRFWVPRQDCNTEIFYYFSATNGNNKTSTKPLVAPEGYYSLFLDGQGVDFYADQQQLMVGESITFQLCDEGQYDFVWNFGEGAEPSAAEGAGPHTVVYQTSGLKTISLTANDDIQVTREDYIEVLGPNNIMLMVETEGQGTTEPEPGTHYYEEGSNVELTATAASGWEFDNWLLMPGEETLDTETITLTLNENTTAKAIFQQSTVSITSPERSLRFMVYPNPSDGHITLSLPANPARVEYTVTTIQGQIIHRGVIPPRATAPLISLNLSGQPAGIYLIRLTDGNVSQLEKVMIR